MDIRNFDDLLQIARLQLEPQRLLFVFAGAELPQDASPKQRVEFAAGQGGELAPLMCVDKAVDELVSFDTLMAESVKAGPPWAIVFVSSLSGRGGVAPASVEADAALRHMVAAIKAGRLNGMLPFGEAGEALQLA